MEKTIASNIIKILGVPPRLNQVVVKRVDQERSHWRVNIYCYDDDTSIVKASRILHSFYVKTNNQGDITYCNPPLAPIYPTASFGKAMPVEAPEAAAAIM